MALLIAVLVRCLIDGADTADVRDVVINLHHPIDNLTVALGKLADQIRLRAPGALEHVAVDKVSWVKRALGHAEHLLLPFRVEVAQFAAVAVEVRLGL